MKTPIAIDELRICGVKLHALQLDDAVAVVSHWVKSGKSFHFVSSTNVNNVAIAIESPGYFQVIENADLSLIDGAPLLWFGRSKGFALRRRCGIEELMEAIFESSNRGSNFSHFFYGNTPEVLAALKKKLLQRFPRLNIAGMLSPPFRALTHQEDEDHIRMINESGADFLWVSLGCPKQEQWLYDHRSTLRVPVGGGAGAVFDFLAGRTRKAPDWVRHIGLEWIFRLLTEPRRLSGRYLIRYPKFMCYFVKYSIGLVPAARYPAGNPQGSPGRQSGDSATK